MRPNEHRRQCVSTSSSSSLSSGPLLRSWLPSSSSWKCSLSSCFDRLLASAAHHTLPSHTDHSLLSYFRPRLPQVPWAS